MNKGYRCPSESVFVCLWDQRLTVLSLLDSQSSTGSFLSGQQGSPCPNVEWADVTMGKASSPGLNLSVRKMGLLTFGMKDGWETRERLLKCRHVGASLCSLALPGSPVRPLQSLSPPSLLPFPVGPAVGMVPRLLEREVTD